MAANKTGAFVMIGLYLFGLVVVGIYFFFKKRKRVSYGGKDSVDQHFLGGRNFGPLVLTFTTFASLFSGYAVVGVPAESFSIGFQSYRWFGAPLMCTTGFYIFHPRIRKLAVTFKFNSPTDMISQRYDSECLSFLCVLCQVLPTILYLIAQFKSIYGTVISLTGNIDAGLVGTIILGLLIFIVESLGGLSSVAATDILQACILIFGFFVVPFLLTAEFGSIEKNMNQILNTSLSGAKTFLDAPAPEKNVANFMWLISFLSFGLYPHMLQRLYAAKDVKSLKYSYSVLCCSPWLTSTPMILLGIYGKIYLSSDTKPNQVFGGMVNKMLTFGPFYYFTASAVLTASLAAIMSTADSALIAISNIFTVDVYKKYLKPAATENEQLFFGKIISFICVVIAVACSTQVINLSTMIEIQGGILLQILPSFVCAMYIGSVSSTSLIFGCIIGVNITLTLAILLFSKVVMRKNMYGVSSGMWGFVSNVIVTIIVQFLLKKFKTNCEPSKSRIKYSDIVTKMQKVKEPINHKIGKILIVLSILFSFLFNPFFFEQKQETKLYSGLPGWTVWMIVIMVFWFLVTVTIPQLWGDENESESDVKKGEEDIYLNDRTET